MAEIRILNFYFCFSIIFFIFVDGRSNHVARLEL